MFSGSCQRCKNTENIRHVYLALILKRWRLLFFNVASGPLPFHRLVQVQLALPAGCVAVARGAPRQRCPGCSLALARVHGLPRHRVGQGRAGCCQPVVWGLSRAVPPVGMGLTPNATMPHRGGRGRRRGVPYCGPRPEKAPWRGWRKQPWASQNSLLTLNSSLIFAYLARKL